MTINKKTIQILSFAMVLLYLVLLGWWFGYNPYNSLSTNNPGSDGRPDSIIRSADDVRIGEFFMQYEDPSVISGDFKGSWPRFRGPDTKNAVQTVSPLNVPESFDILWQFETGEGHAAPAIHNGRVYVLDYDETLRADALRCFSLETGKELWRRWYRVALKRNHGFSRTVPFVNDDYIITIGPQGHIMCCDPVSGEMKWSLDAVKQYNTEVPLWYTGQCPMVENDILVLATGGDAILAGIDCKTGEELWRTPNTDEYKMSHSSVMSMTLSGKRTYIYAADGAMCGISAEPADMGRLLWKTSEFKPNVIAPSPLQLSPTKVFLTAGYGSGGALLEVNGSGNNLSAKITLKYRPREGACSEQQTPVIYNNMIITVLPKDGGGNRDRLVCYPLDNLKNPVWVSPADEKFGYGPYMIINDMLYILKDDGELYVYQIGRNEMILKKRQRILDGIDAWGPLAYADGKLILRDAHNVICLKLM